MPKQPNKNKHRILYADDRTETVGQLLRIRLPSLMIGLVLGAATSVMVSRFEHILESNLSVAFFIPFIAYISAAVGTQTETIYVRNLGKRRASIKTYLKKELLLGLTVGGCFGLLVALFIMVWLKEFDVAVAVGSAMFISVTCATVISIIIPTILRNHEDPAVGGGPITAVIQDALSISIYFVIASLIIL